MTGLYLIPNQQNLEESVDVIKAHQGFFEYNDFFTGAILDDKKEQLKRIENYAKVRSDFSKDTMHGAFLDVTVHSSDKKIQEISQLRIRQSMDIAKEMGLRGVVFHTNRLQGFRDTFYLNNWLEANERFFREICETYPNQQIFMENMFDESPDMLAKLSERMQEVPNFGVCLDYAHAIISETGIEEWIKQLAPFVRHMHINDNDLKYDLHASVGSGKIDWKQFVTLMKQYQIDATILVEVTGIEKQIQSLEYMKANAMYSLVEKCGTDGCH